jgi:hypothetical protein
MGIIRIKFGWRKVSGCTLWKKSDFGFHCSYLGVRRVWADSQGHLELWGQGPDRAQLLFPFYFLQIFKNKFKRNQDSIKRSRIPGFGPLL